jgi:hypothetical protein
MNEKACTRRYWTPSEIEQLRRLYPDMPAARVARRLRRPIYCVYNKAAKLGLRKSEAFLASSESCRLRRGHNVGAATRFKPGHVPLNKGVRGWDAGGRSHETRFKKGELYGAARMKLAPIGAVVIDKDGHRKLKVSDDRTVSSRRNWKFVHAVVWEKKHGPVSPGHAIVFRNGNKADIRLRNLECVTRQELMRRNSVHRLPKELAVVIQLRGAVVRQLRRRSA